MKRSTAISFVLCALLAMSTFLSTIYAGQKTGFTWKNQPEKQVADLYYNGNPVLQYVYPYDDSSAESLHDTYKVFHHVYGPASKAIITKGPGGKYTHHRGLYVGWNKTKFDGKELDFWHCKNGAHLRHATMIDMKRRR